MEQVIISRSKQSKYYLAIGILIVCLFNVPYFILGEDSYIRIQDTLDGRLSRLVSFAREGHFTSLNIVNPAIMNGINDNALGSMFNLTLVTFLIFKPFVAYVINALIVHLVAFVGMFLLLRKHFLQNEETTWVVFGCSLSFALVPHMPLLGLSVVGQPLLLFAFMNIFKERPHVTDYLLIIILPFYSFLALSNIFILCALVLFLLWDFIKNKQINKSYLLGVFIFTIACGIAEYNLIIQSFVGNRFASHRTEWNPFFGSYSAKAAIETAFSNFVYLDSHAYSLHTPILFFSALAVITIVFRNKLFREYKKLFLITLAALVGLFFIAWFNIGYGIIPIAKIKEMYFATSLLLDMDFLLVHPYNQQVLKIIAICLLFFNAIIFLTCICIVILTAKKRIILELDSKLLPVLLITAFIISLFYGFYHWSGLIIVKEKITFLKMFQLDRFYFLHPLIWYLIFALSLSIIYRTKHGKYLVLFFIVFQIYYLLINNNKYYNNFVYNAKTAYCKIIGESIDSRGLTYNRFFSEGLYREIKDYLVVPQKDYRVVSIGLYPSIATYNGFYTLDAYVNDYPLEYKHGFRKIIEGELNKSKKWREYFDYWGSRCYIFVAELQDLWFENTKVTTRKIVNLDLNTEQLKSMGGKYIFSGFEIVNAEHNKLSLLKIFERTDSPWRIYLYQCK